jgi:5'-nucleotidase
VSAALRPLILLTNDDGVHAPGLLALHCALRTWADIAILAPERNWSASGHSKTMHKPLRVSPTRLEDGTEALAASGSPSDCVALALLGVVERRPDLVVSGINVGENVSTDLTYSGTVAAAMEGYIGGVSSMAVSLNSHQPYDPAAAARYASLIARRMLRAATAAPILLNVNVPALPFDQIRGIAVTRLGLRVYRDALDLRADPRGRTYYWIGGEPPAGVPEEGTDVGALEAGFVSVTPIHLDLTDYARLEDVRSWALGDPGA